jgi:hypothetical protein
VLVKPDPLEVERLLEYGKLVIIGLDNKFPTLWLTVTVRTFENTSGQEEEDDLALS